MKNRGFFWVSVWILLNLLISGCNNQASDAQIPDLGISEDEINTRVRLEAPKGWNSFKIGEIIGLNVIVISDDQIAFHHDYGAKIFIREGEEWVEVANLMKYPEGYILLSQSKDEPLKQGSAGVVPNLPDSGKKVTVRIILIGNIYRNGKITDEQTAAFIDVELKP